MRWDRDWNWWEGAQKGWRGGAIVVGDSNSSGGREGRGGWGWGREGREIFGFDWLVWIGLLCFASSWFGWFLFGLDWNGLDMFGLDLLGLGWTGLDWIGLDWVELFGSGLFWWRDGSSI